MQIVLTLPTQKYISLCAFIVCMLKAVFSVFQLINGYDISTLDDTVILLRDCVDIAVWFVIALLFLHIFLYREKRIGRSRLSVSFNVAIVFVMVKVLFTILCTLFFVDKGIWSIVYSVIESLILLWVFIYLCRVWYAKSKDKRKLHQHNKSQDGYTLKDELERRFSH